MKVITSETAWKGFLRRAKRAWPKEHIEAVWGTEVVDAFRISQFRRIKIKTASTGHVQSDELDFERQKWLASQSNLQFLGTAHSHPHKNHDSAPSTQDYEGAILDGERMMGVVHLWKSGEHLRFKIDARWWLPQQPMSLEILPDD